jgi:hypothetical protein
MKKLKAVPTVVDEWNGCNMCDFKEVISVFNNKRKALK